MQTMRQGTEDSSWLAEGEAKGGVGRGTEHVGGGQRVDGRRDRVEWRLSRVLALLGPCLRPRATPDFEDSASDLTKFRVVCLCCVCIARDTVVCLCVCTFVCLPFVRL